MKSTNQNSSSSILCEIIGAQKLYSAAISEDCLTFCTVKLGSSNNDDEKKIHTTDTVEGENPIWTITSKCIFLISEALLSTECFLTFQLYSHRKYSESSFRVLSENNLIGQVKLEASHIRSHCNGERLEYHLNSNKRNIDLGRMAFRFRLAQKSDETILESLQGSPDTRKVEFIKSFLGNQNKTLPLAEMITETDESEIIQTSFLNIVDKLFSSDIVYDTNDNTELIRVKPHPDPRRPMKTEYMTKSEIEKETYQTSHSWVQAGSGKLGKLYVEVLKCNELPNLDIGEAIGDLTDSFVTLVYEDTAAMTDVIDNELSPHWLPWSQRAFCFKSMYPSSVLYLGVFDYDLGTANNHDPVGRVAVNLSNLLPSTEYTLKYNLYPSSNVTDRTKNGSITIRLKIEINDEIAALMAGLGPRPKINVNVEKEKTFRVIRYTCFGEFDGEQSFDLTVTRSYLNEIMGYKQSVTYTIYDSVTSLMFWRGQVFWGDSKTKIPLYSFLFFVGASHLIEKPYLIIPFTLITISSIMMAQYTIRQQHPSPWYRCPPILQYLNVLRLGFADVSKANHTKLVDHPSTTINAFEGDEEARAYEAAIKDRIETDRERAEEKELLKKQIQSFGEDNISTEMPNGGLIIPIDLQKRLARYQGMIGRICSFSRLIRSLLIWEENVLSFWITLLFFSTGIISLLLPWRFILLWTGRSFVWGLFGPHMKLVDLCFGQEKYSEKGLVKNSDILFRKARLRREEARKIQDIKVLAFGKYSIQVPSYNLVSCIISYSNKFPENLTVFGFFRLCRHVIMTDHFLNLLPQNVRKLQRI
jgi:hypothetical protein